MRSHSVAVIPLLYRLELAHVVVLTGARHRSGTRTIHTQSFTPPIYALTFERFDRSCHLSFSSSHIAIKSIPFSIASILPKGPK